VRKRRRRKGDVCVCVCVCVCVALIFFLVCVLELADFARMCHALSTGAEEEEGGR